MFLLAYTRYQFNPHLSRDETITNILVKALTDFPSPDFSLCIHLLPPHLLVAPPHLTTSTSNPAAGDAPLAEAVQKLFVLNTQLCGAQYTQFWNTLDSDDLYADLVADVSGFEELIRVRIAGCVGQAVREVQRPVLEAWLNLQGKDFERFVSEVCEWAVDGDTVKVPLNKENEAKGTVIRENVKFDRKSFCYSFSMLGYMDCIKTMLCIAPALYPDNIHPVLPFSPSSFPSTLVTSM